MQKNATAAKPYDSDVELLKIVATFFVIMIHSSGSGSFANVFFNSISRFSVPVFVVISGYYMLNRQPDAMLIAKKCKKLFGLMLLWSGVYFLYDMIAAGEGFPGVGEMIRYLLTEPVHLWYIYAAVTLYLFTPVLYVFHANATGNEYRYALALSFLLGSVVVVLVRSEAVSVLPVILDRMKVPYMLGFVFLYLTGGYLRRFGIEKSSHRNVLYFLGLICPAVTIAGTLVLPARGVPGDLLLSFFAPNTMLPAIALFVFVRQTLGKRPVPAGKLCRIIHTITGCTMGIYFLHPLILRLLAHIPMAWDASPWLLVPLRTVTAMLASLAAILVMKKIPLLKKMI